MNNSFQCRELLYSFYEPLHISFDSYVCRNDMNSSAAFFQPANGCLSFSLGCTPTREDKRPNALVLYQPTCHFEAQHTEGVTGRPRRADG